MAWLESMAPPLGHGVKSGRSPAKLQPDGDGDRADVSAAKKRRTTSLPDETPSEMPVSNSNVKTLRSPSALAILSVPLLLAALVNGCASDQAGTDQPALSEGVNSEANGLEVTVALRDGAMELVGTRAVEIEEHAPLESHDDSPQFGQLSYTLKTASGIVRGTVPDPRVVRVEKGENEQAHSQVLRANYGEIVFRLPTSTGVLTLREPGGRSHTLDLSANDALTTQKAGDVRLRDINLDGGSMQPEGRGPSGAEPVTLQAANRCDGTVGVLFVPEGYTQAEMTEFHSLVEALALRMKKNFPDMAALSRHFALYYVDIASKESGISEPGKIRDTAFGLEYLVPPGPDGGAATESRTNWIVLPSSRRKKETSAAVLRARTKTKSEVVVIVPNIKEGRSNASPNERVIRLVPHGWVHSTLVHEIGHALPWLADEYAEEGRCDLATAGARPNTTKTPANPKWKSFFSAAPVQGAEYCAEGVYRPAERCLMNDHRAYNQFCPVCRKAFDDNFSSRRVTASRWPSCRNYRYDAGADAAGIGSSSGASDAGIRDARADATVQPCNARPKGACGAGNVCAWTGLGYCCRPEIPLTQQCATDDDCGRRRICTATREGGTLTCAEFGSALCTE
jgi:hypothetical protein